VGCDEREQGVETMDHAEEVYVHNLVEVGAVFPAAFEANSCIESKEVDFT